MASISVTPDQLRTESSFMIDRRNSAEGEFTNLRSRLQNLESCFTGSAQAAFQGRYEEWDKSATQMLEALQGLGDFLKQAADTLEETDKQLAQGLNG